MEVILKYSTLSKIVWDIKNDSKSYTESFKELVYTLDHIYGIRLNKDALDKLEKFYKSFERRLPECSFAKIKFFKMYEKWLKSDLLIEIKPLIPGRPSKAYDEVTEKTKKKKQEELLAAHPPNLIKDTFKTALLKTQPKNVGRIVDVLPLASPKRVKRMVESIPTPKSTTEFTEEDALALILNLGLSRNKYSTMRKALREKGWGCLPSKHKLYNTRTKMVPSNIYVDELKARVKLADLVENTAVRIISNFTEEQLNTCNNSEVVLISKWGCDGSSGFSEYKQQTEIDTNFASIFMASLVPLRMRLYKDQSSSSKENAFQDIWINRTPGSKYLCRPIRFEYTKEDRNTTRSLVNEIKEEIAALPMIVINQLGRNIKVSFQLQLTMIDGKVANALTGVMSNWRCNICGKKNGQFEDKSDENLVNENALNFGISPLHCRIRFMEYCLHLSYDLKYRTSPGNRDVSARNNQDLHKMRQEEKNRIQLEFKQKGLIIDKPLYGYGSTNDGNSARRFFEDPVSTSKITGLDEHLLRRFKVILAVINSKKMINSTKFEAYSNDTKNILSDLYSWKALTPTVHKVLHHGKEIVEYNILPLGELTEEAQESRNRDVKQFRLFNTRKSTKFNQNYDLLQYLLLSSDPVLYSIRTKWLPKICDDIDKDDPDAIQIKELLNFDTLDYLVENKIK